MTQLLQQFVRFIAIVVLVFWPVAAVVGDPTNFDTCLVNVQAGQFGIGPDIGGTDNHGRPVNVSVATALTYQLCVEACGAGQEPFSWNVFSQQFGAWLLPWLALVSQLPFGANDNLDNLVSVLLTVGSPTLAAYSLIITILNGRWIARRFSAYTYPNVRNATRILSSLQQAPLEIETELGLLASLVVLPENDKWWKELIVGIDYTYTWSIAAATSIAWVVLAFLFTLIDSYTGGITNSINSNGQGVGSLWLWLLPIIIGWLQISPKCDSFRLLSAIERANKIAYVATNGRPVLVGRTTSETQAFELSIKQIDHLRTDEKRTVPIYNYARLFPWVQAVEKVSEAFEAASHHYHNHDSVDPLVDWVTVEKGNKPDDTNRAGDTTQVQNYCILQPGQRHRSHWGPQCLSRIFVASILALVLQWGTAGAAIVVVWYTPTQGLGCRSASYLLYAVLSTVVWMLLLTSSILTHYCARGHDGQIIYHWSRIVARSLSITFRRLGKVIAGFNTVLIVLACVFQFGNFFDRCYCNSSVFSLRDKAYNVIALVPDDISALRTAWLGGVCLAAASASVYFLVVGLLINPTLPDDPD